MIKSIRDKSKLVQVQKVVNSKGKSFYQNFWVKPSDVKSTDKVLSAPKVDKFDKSHFDSIKSYKAKALEYLKSVGVVWNEHSHPGINWMRAMQAISSSVKDAQPSTTQNKVSSLRKVSGSVYPTSLSDDQAKEIKAATTSKEKVVLIKKFLGSNSESYFESLGISWNKHSHRAINLMRMSIAAEKYFESGDAISKEKIETSVDKEKIEITQDMTPSIKNRAELINSISDEETLKLIASVGMIPEDDVAKSFIEEKMDKSWSLQKIVGASREENSDGNRGYVSDIITSDPHFPLPPRVSLYGLISSVDCIKLASPRDFISTSFNSFNSKSDLNKIHDESLIACSADKDFKDSWYKLDSDGYDMLNYETLINPQDMVVKLNAFTELPESDKRFIKSVSEIAPNLNSSFDAFSYSELKGVLLNSPEESGKLLPAEKHGFYKFLERLEKEGSDAAAIKHMKSKYKEFYECFDNNFILFSKFSGCPLAFNYEDAVLNAQKMYLDPGSVSILKPRNGKHYSDLLNVEAGNSVSQHSVYYDAYGDSYHIKKSAVFDGLRNRLIESFVSRGYTQEDIDYSLRMYATQVRTTDMAGGIDLSEFPMYKKGSISPNIVNLSNDKFNNSKSYVVGNDIPLHRFLLPLYFSRLVEKTGSYQEAQNQFLTSTSNPNKHKVLSIACGAYDVLSIAKQLKSLTPEKMARAAELKGELFGMKVVDIYTGNDSKIKPENAIIGDHYSHAKFSSREFSDHVENIHIKLSKYYKYVKDESAPSGVDQVIASMCTSSTALSSHPYELAHVHDNAKLNYRDTPKYGTKLGNSWKGAYDYSGLMRIMQRSASIIQASPTPMTSEFSALCVDDVTQLNFKAQRGINDLPTVSKEQIEAYKDYAGMSSGLTVDGIVGAFKDNGVLRFAKKDVLDKNPLISNILQQTWKSMANSMPGYQKIKSSCNKHIKSSAEVASKFKSVKALNTKSNLPIDSADDKKMGALLKLRKEALDKSNCSLKTTTHEKSAELRVDFMKNWDYEEEDKKLYSGKNSLNGEDRRVLFNSRFFEVNNSSFEEGFSKKVAETKQAPMNLYHATSYAATAGIMGVSGQFRWDSDVAVKAGRMLGAGAYFGAKGGKSAVYVGNEPYASVHQKQLKSGAADGCYIISDVVRGAEGDSKESNGKMVREWEIAIKNNDCIKPKYIVDVSCRNVGKVKNVKRNANNEYLDSDGNVTHDKNGVSVTMK